jgi:RNA polymerase sigma-70 factor (ECF subfamily)
VYEPPFLLALPVSTPQQSSAAEFVSLFLSEQRRIYCYIVTLTGNPQDAEDLLQETASLLFTKFDEYRPGSSFFSWACQTAHYLVLNHRRKQSRQAIVLDDDVLELLAEVPAAEDEIISIRRTALHACLAKLSVADRNLFERRYAAAVAVKVLAVELGRSADSVCRSLGRIRRALIQCVGRTLRTSEQTGEGS